MAITLEMCEDDAEKLGCSVHAVYAVAQVESRGGGFNPDGTPKTLFEGHWFHKYTKGAYAAAYPSISYPKWTKQFYGKTWQQEQERLKTALSLNATAARMSTSWGAFQIMGFNFSVCGYTSVDTFVEDMHKDENAHLQAFTGYVLGTGLAKHLAALDWDKFAYFYNGPEYQKNDYAGKLARAYAKSSSAS